MVLKSITVRSLVARFSQNSALKLSLYQFHDTSTIFTLSFFFFPSYLEVRNHYQQQLFNLTWQWWPGLCRCTGRSPWSGSAGLPSCWSSSTAGWSNHPENKQAIERSSFFLNGSCSRLACSLPACRGASEDPIVWQSQLQTHSRPLCRSCRGRWNAKKEMKIDHICLGPNHSYSKRQ